jgi:hypothetical protein
VKVATPVELTVPDPIEVPPSKKVTVPVSGAPLLGETTLAVKVTGCPTTWGLAELDRITFVDAIKAVTVTEPKPVLPA